MCPPHLGILVPILTCSRTFFRQGTAQLSSMGVALMDFPQDPFLNMGQIMDQVG